MDTLAEVLRRLAKEESDIFENTGDPENGYDSIAYLNAAELVEYYLAPYQQPVSIIMLGEMTEEEVASFKLRWQEIVMRDPPRRKSLIPCQIHEWVYCYDYPKTPTRTCSNCYRIEISRSTRDAKEEKWIDVTYG